MATVIQGTQQFRGAFKEMWMVTETVNFANAATGSGTFASVDVTIAVLSVTPSMLCCPSLYRPMLRR